VFGEACNRKELFDELQQQNWDLVILDLALPGRGGLELLKELKRAYPKLPVLVLTMYPEDQLGVRVFRAGAAGYATKGSAPGVLVKAARRVLAGRRYVSASLAEQLAADLGTPTQEPLHGTLSDREFQVMRLIASGKTAKEIAQELALSVKTVSTYRARLLEKMKMKTNAEVTHYAVKNNLVD
jgi:DNA-binding NarL/FixJ family response regulator